MTRSRRERGFITLAEVLVASAITSIVAAGLMGVFVAAARLHRVDGSPSAAEASAFGEQTMELFRNMVACDSAWFDPTTCGPGAGLPATWTDLPLPGGGGTETMRGAGAVRRYCVTPRECDGVAPAGDCYTVRVTVCWDGTSCPAVGTACP